MSEKIGSISVEPGRNWATSEISLPAGADLETDRSVRNLWFYINSLLGAHERFPDDGKVTRFLKSRLDLINQTGPKTELIVVHASSPNAYVIQGYLVVTDGFLKLLRTREENDGLVAHEITHVQKGHLDTPHDQISGLRRIGRTRANEIEADIAPLEFLDDLGINPIGVIDLTTRLSENRGDIEHGALLDRRLNLKQALWLIDVRNLSTKTNPHGLEDRDFESYQKDSELWANYYKLDFISRRHLLNREFKKEEHQRIVSFTELLGKQKELLRESDPNLQDEDVEDLLILSVFCGYNVNQSRPESEKAFKDWLDRIQSKEKILKLVDLSDNRVLLELGINVQYGLFQIVSKAVEQLFNTVDRINMDEYFDLADQFFKTQKIFPQIYYSPLFEILKNKNLLNLASIKFLTNKFVDLPVSNQSVSMHLAKVLDIKEDLEELRVSGVHYPDPEIDNLDRDDWYDDWYTDFEDRIVMQQQDERLDVFLRFDQRLSNQRFEKAMQISDSLELLNYLMIVDFKFEVEDEILESHFQNIPIPSMIERLKRFNGDQKLDISKQLFVQLLVKTYEERMMEPEKNKFEEELEKKSAINAWKKDFKERLLFWAICLNKEEYLSHVKSHMKQVDLSDIGGLRKLWEMVQEIKDAPIEAKKIGFDVKWSVKKEDFSQLEDLLLEIRSATLAQAVRIPSQAPKILKQIIKSLPIFSIVPLQNKDAENWQNIGLRILEGLDADDLSVDKLEEFFAFVCLSGNTQLLLQVPPIIMEKITSKLTFEEALDYIFKKYRHLPKIIFSGSLDQLTESEARTVNELSELEDEVRYQIKAFLGEEEFMGKMALSDIFLNYYRSREKSTERRLGVVNYQVSGLESKELLKAILGTARSDEAFKRYIFERWWMIGRAGAVDNPLHRFFKIEDFLIWRSKESLRLQFWLDELPRSTLYRPFDQIIQESYMANWMVRQAILRKIMVGEGGVLHTDQGRQDLSEAFFNYWVKLENNEVIVRSLVSALMSTGQEEELYLHLSPILGNMILKPPKVLYPYENIALEIADESLQSLKKAGELINSTENDRQLMVNRIMTLITGGHSNRENTDAHQINSKILGLFQEKEDEKALDILTPWELAIIVGTKAGGPGIRILQLCGQYFDVPEDTKERLLGVYDAVKGQTRLQAFRVLSREAKTNPLIAELIENIEEITPTIGGGSLVTVYGVRLKDGSLEAVSIRNPNVEYHLGETIDLLRRVVQKAIIDNPEDRNYKILSLLLDDVEEWLINELNDPNFEEKDQRFRKLIDSNIGKFNKGNNKYNILVPRHKPTGTRWIRRDEYIGGKNFTSLEVTDEPTDIMGGKLNRDDYRQAVSLLVRNYMFQMLDAGLVHSDIHPGNFRITSENKNIAIFDRYNLLELNDRDKKLLRGFVGAFRNGGVKKATEQLVNYVLELENNAGLSFDRDQLQTEINNLGQNGDAEKTILNTMILLKQKGLRIPLKIALIGKNLQVLNRMAKSAGLSGLAEAFKKTATKEELVKFALMS